jgi:hypothetical protein
MTGTALHRIFAVTLAGLFFLFNVGIPVVIATCSMPAMMNGPCPMCEGRDVPSTPTLLNDMSKPCCTSTIVAAPGKVEFMQARAHEFFSTLVVMPLAQSYAGLVDIHARSTVGFASASPPASVDIPILVSSLLI